ncbi:MAG: hypothetical protein JNK67_06425 [Alphaproteobacteria bacterium]|nr:hypothetical protein [Alphaproteobacteria bacterium]
MANERMSGGRIALIVAIIAVSIAAGVAASLANPPVGDKVTMAVAAVALPLGAVALGAKAALTWMDGARWLAAGFVVLAILQALLAIPAIQGVSAMLGW